MTALIIDYAWAKPDPAQIKANGYVGVVRYLSHDASKSLSAAEREALHAQGLGISLVFEDGAQRALGGAADGKADGLFANAQADALGFPRSLPLFYAVDFNVTAAQLPIVLAYIVAAGATGRRAAGYGSTALVNYLMAHGVGDDWQTCAWSSGIVNDKAVLYQRLRPTTGLAGSFDEDVVLTPHPDFLWFPTPAPVPASADVVGPTAHGADMDRLYKRASSNAAYAFGGSCRVWVDYVWYEAAGKPPIITLPDSSNFWSLPVVGHDAPS